VDVLGGVERPFQGPGSPPSDGHVIASDEREDAQGVARGLLDGDVAGHGGDGEQVEVGVPAGQHQGHGVVVAGVYVQDHGLRTHLHSPR
jgi:hypothetical protein